MPIFTSNGKPVWSVVAQTGGAAAFKDASTQGAAVLVAKGTAMQSDNTALNTGITEVVTEAQKIETDRFETILTTSGAMDKKTVQKWLNNPHTTLGRNTGNGVLKDIHLDVIRTMSTE